VLSVQARSAPPAPILSDPHPGFGRWILHVAYDLAWLVVLVLAAPWWLSRCVLDERFARMARGRLGAGWPRERAPGARRRILLHGVSVGEIKGARALVRALEREHPELEVVLSTTTDTGMEVASKLYPGLRVVRFPIDWSPIVRLFLARVDPLCVVLVELEIWPNFLRCANRAGVPVAVVNGRITPKSFKSYHRFKNLLPQFDRISLFCAQDQEYAQRFAELFAARERILVSGNLKADGLKLGRVQPSAELVALLGPRDGAPVLVAGSTHAPEERWLVEAWRAAGARWRLILVPRHPERARELIGVLAGEPQQAGAAPQLLSRLRAGEAPDPARPALVDTIGELEQVYALADLVFVGGSLVEHGGQNMLEPAAQEKPVLYGPHVGNFHQEAGLLERAGASVRIAGVAELGPEIERLLGDHALRGRMAQAGVAAVATQRGATELTLRALAERCFASERSPGPAHVAART
jgi:3-deoxy-D-manno-octulosonic-acid transferase